MFALAGIVYAEAAAADRPRSRLPTALRSALALVVSVAVELFLHASGTFHWDYWWWNAAVAAGDRRVRLPVVLPVRRLGLRRARRQARWRRVGTLAAIDVAMGLVFGVALGWL